MAWELPSEAISRGLSLGHVGSSGCAGSGGVRGWGSGVDAMCWKRQQLAQGSLWV